MSFHAAGDDGELELQVYQLLAHPRKMTLVRTAGSSPESYRRTFNAVSLNVWLRRMRGLEPSELDCLELVSEEIDIAAMMQANVDLRSSLMVWQKKDSDVYGCFNLHSPQRPTPELAIVNPKYPTLALWDALDASEYVWVTTQ